MLFFRRMQYYRRFTQNLFLPHRRRMHFSRTDSRFAPNNNRTLIIFVISKLGGSAGAVVASRLSDIHEWKVLLLEAGPDEPPGAEVPSMVAMFLGKFQLDHPRIHSAAVLLPIPRSNLAMIMSI